MELEEALATLKLPAVCTLQEAESAYAAELLQLAESAGDGPGDKQLVKCGIQFVQSTIRILEGPTPDLKGSKAKLENNPNQTFDLTVSVDLDKQQVTLTTNNQTLTAKLERPLKSITHTGFAAWNSVTDFVQPLDQRSDR